MIPKPISPTELRQNLYAVVREVASGEGEYLVTPSDGEGVVMLSREAYNALVAERDVLRDLRRAEADVAAGRTHSTTEVRAFLAKRAAAGRRPKTKRR
jgi:PHD/YefM family antitoxin component YafN of YafNO toxin-antitoxin module